MFYRDTILHEHIFGKSLIGKALDKKKNKPSAKPEDPKYTEDEIKEFSKAGDELIKKNFSGFSKVINKFLSSANKEVKKVFTIANPSEAIAKKTISGGYIMYDILWYNPDELDDDENDEFRYLLADIREALNNQFKEFTFDIADYTSGSLYATIDYSAIRGGD